MLTACPAAQALLAAHVNKHTLKAGQGAPGMGHWLYNLPTAPFTKVANGPFKWGLQHRFGLVRQGQDTFVESSFQVPNRSARNRWTI